MEAAHRKGFAAPHLRGLLRVPPRENVERSEGEDSPGRQPGAPQPPQRHGGAQARQNLQGDEVDGEQAL